VITDQQEYISAVCSLQHHNNFEWGATTKPSSSSSFLRKAATFYIEQPIAFLQL